MSAAACARCGSAVQSGEPCARCLLGGAPRRFEQGRLELGRSAGRGGFGEVFEAWDVGAKRKVAVKCLLHADPSRFAQLEREAAALAELAHPNVLRVLRAGIQDGEPYLVTEWIDGRPLTECIPLEKSRAIEVLSDVASGLHHAHSQGILHRDLKASNVLLRADGSAVLCDFGSARKVGQGGVGWTLTEDGARAVTPLYVPPEVLAGDAHDLRSEVYGLGVILYEALTGAPPVGNWHTRGDALDAVLRKALATLPGDRYADAASFLRALQTAATAPAPTDGLGPAETQWLQAVALLHTAATAVLGWTMFSSLTPRVMLPGDAHPLSFRPANSAHDGPPIALVHFDLWPAMGSVGAFALAFAAAGFFTHALARAGAALLRPDVPVPETQKLWGVGALALLSYLLGEVVWPHSLYAELMPFFGAFIELGAMYLLWMGLLRCRVRGRRFSAEWQIFAAFSLALVPPAHRLWSYAAPWYQK